MLAWAGKIKKWFLRFFTISTKRTSPEIIGEWFKPGFCAVLQLQPRNQGEICNFRVIPYRKIYALSAYSISVYDIAKLEAEAVIWADGETIYIPTMENTHNSQFTHRLAVSHLLDDDRRITVGEWDAGIQADGYSKDAVFSRAAKAIARQSLKITHLPQRPSVLWWGNYMRWRKWDEEFVLEVKRLGIPTERVKISKIK
jgi:hypothetical protein